MKRILLSQFEPMKRILLSLGRQSVVNANGCSAMDSNERSSPTFCASAKKALCAAGVFLLIGFSNTETYSQTRVVDLSVAGYQLTGTQNCYSVGCSDCVPYSVLTVCSESQGTPMPVSGDYIIVDMEKARYISSFTITLQNSPSFSQRQITLETAPTAVGPWNLASNFTTDDFQAFNNASGQVFTYSCIGGTLLLPNVVSRYWKINFVTWPTRVWSCGLLSSEARVRHLGFFELPIITTTGSTYLQNGECVTLTSEASGETYQWSTGETTQSITVCSPGVYTVQVTNTQFIGNQDHVASISIDQVDDQSDAWAPDGPVLAIARMDSTIYLGGSFSYVGPVTGSAALVDNTTAQHNALLPRVDGVVNAIISDGSGGWYVGGKFSRIGTYAISNLAHINANNTVDVGFVPQPNDTVNTLLLNGGSLYLGGAFTTVQGLSANYLASVNRNTGASNFWNPNVNGAVNSIGLYNDLLVVGGRFTALGGQTRNRLGALDTLFAQASTWDPAPNAQVRKVYVVGNKLYVGGDFTSIGGVSRGYLASYNLPAFAIEPWNAGANAAVSDLLLEGTSLYVAGAFTVIGGANRNYLAAISPVNGLSSSFNPNPDNRVLSLAWSDNHLIVGGLFTNMGGQGRKRLAKVSSTGLLAAWHPDIRGLIGGTTPSVRCLAINGSNIYAGGSFYSLGGADRNNLASVDFASGVLTSWNPNANGIVRALAVGNNSVYAGGDFTTVNGNISKGRVAQLSASTGIANGWNPNANNSVNAIALNGSSVYLGGTFTQVGGASRNNLAEISASGASTGFNPSPNGVVNALSVGNSKLYVGGAFTTISGASRSRYANYDLGSQSLVGNSVAFNGNVNALAAAPGGVYVGGAFTSIGSVRRIGFAALGQSDDILPMNPDFTSGGVVNSLHADSNAVHQGGTFSFSNNFQPMNNLVATAATDIRPGYWQPQPNGAVRALHAYGDKVYVGGDFRTIESRYHPHFVGIDGFIYTNTAPVVNDLSATTLCAGQSTVITGSGFLQVSDVRVGGVSVSYSIISADSISITVPLNVSGVVEVINPLGSGSSSQTVTVLNGSAATVTASGSAALCTGQSVVLTSSAADSYLWSNGATTQSITVTQGGNYSVSVSNNGCSATSSVTTVTVNPAPTATVSAIGSTTFCSGGSVTLTASAGSSYLWSNGATTQSISVTQGGNYSVSVSNNGCSATSSVTTVAVNPAPTATVSAIGSTTFCSGGSVTLTASAGGSYLWSNGAATQNITVSQAGNYAVAVTDANGCQATSSEVTVTVNPAPSAGVTAGGATTFCSGGSVTLTAQGTGSYQWSNGATTQSITVTQGGNYAVTITGNGCSATSSVTTVTVNPVPTATVSAIGSTTFCSGGSVTLTASAGSSYLWSNGATTQNITVSQVGNYAVAVTDANGCQATSSVVTVTVNPAPSAGVTAGGATTFCTGGSVTLTAQGTGSYQWSNGATTQSITVTQGGNYAVTVTGNGCSATSSVTTVTVNPAPTASITAQGSPNLCQGGSVVLQASGGDTYQWNTGAQSSSISVNQSGVYTVQVSQNGCSAQSQQQVTVNPLPSVSLQPIAALCANSSAVAITGGSPAGGTYTLNGVSAITLDPAQTGSGAQTVAYTYTDGNGCSNTATQSVTVNPLPIVSFSGLNSNYTLADIPTQLVGTPAGGLFSGNGVVNGTFDPAIAGLGTHCITYQYVDGNNCGDNAQLCTTVDINVNVRGIGATVEDAVSVHPNPSYGLFTVVMDGVDGIVHLNVLDVLGREVVSHSLTSRGRTAHNIDLSSFASGVYTLRIQSAKGVSGMKLVKE
jgi:hypothetical protein